MDFANLSEVWPGKNRQTEMFEPGTASFLESLQGARDIGAMERALDLHLRGFGVDSYAYLGQRPSHHDDPWLAITTYPEEWATRYSAKAYIYADPVILKARQTRLPFAWTTVTKLTSLPAKTKKQQRILREAADFGCRYGLTVPLRGFKGEFASLNISFGEEKEAYEDVVKRGNHELLISALYFHDSIWKDLAGQQSTSSIYLTERQTEILCWLAVGKTIADVGDILSISESTVRLHVLNAAEQLGTPNLTSTVARAIALGFICP